MKWNCTLMFKLTQISYWLELNKITVKIKTEYAEFNKRTYIQTKTFEISKFLYETGQSDAKFNNNENT